MRVLEVSTSSVLSIHAPTSGATSYPLLRSGKHPTFNPRSYKRSDVLIKQATKSGSILSIHAPTRGATSVNHLGK